MTTPIPYSEKPKVAVEHSVSTSIREVAFALSQHADKLDNQALLYAQHYNQSLDILEKCQGHVIVCGMGKSGIVGSKLAATLASTGTPSFFVHPGEAFHGDLGMITRDSVVVLISNSGSTSEIVCLLPSLKKFGNQIIAMTGGKNSPLAHAADAVLDISVDKEVCPNNLAPTTSTTLTAVVGDAIAVELMKRKKFKPLDFAKYHPGGALGKLLLSKVEDHMRVGLLTISEVASWSEIVNSIEAGGVGIAVVVNEFGQLSGVITDGDIRRILGDEGISRADVIAGEFMTKSPLVVRIGVSMFEAESLMREKKVRVLLVLDNQDMCLGAVEFAS